MKARGPTRARGESECSLRFSFGGPRSLCRVVGHLKDMGFSVDAVVWYPPDGSTGPLSESVPKMRFKRRKGMDP